MIWRLAWSDSDIYVFALMPRGLPERVVRYLAISKTVFWR